MSALDWLALIAFSLFALVGMLLSRTYGRSAFVGLLFGTLLGPLGWLLIAARGGRRCADCGQYAQDDASKCSHCGRQFVRGKITAPITSVPITPPAPVDPAKAFSSWAASDPRAKTSPLWTNDPARAWRERG